MQICNDAIWGRQRTSSFGLGISEADLQVGAGIVVKWTQSGQTPCEIGWHAMGDLPVIVTPADRQAISAW
jgi:hypothetical protein